MRMSVLASGSSGNSTYVETEKGSLLIDVGLTCKRIEEGLGQIGTSLKNIDGILITHEHSDHIKGLKVIAKRYDIPIFANDQTWQQLDRKNIEVPSEQKFHFNPLETKEIVGMDVQSFHVSHDAIDPQFYTFMKDGKKLSVITDTGYVSDQMKGIIKESDCFIFESNHDVDMLRMGRYPWVTKQRILSDVGHVSNEDAAHAMKDVITDKTKRIYLSHLSLDNNIKELAKMSVEQILSQYDIDTDNEIQLHHTDKNTPTEIYTI
ncbi:MBL fold metallo-hydrolase [Lacicoccus alkaliphilus]|uniref:Phosphoribosyl 1,2-cyclic phosphodiesterase n=1 Tax=Lacicoccus alkaliphilus DSM 16010 TaxID=1123231 RepID=A0A1M7GKE4_9BACL|nr:Phosphoribosyl 1,2-cyclic phosphodiesterase [Salinicoccus alkaliphilus DSM 16010]